MAEHDSSGANRSGAVAVLAPTKVAGPTRRWSVSMPPQEAVDAVAAAPGLEPRALAADDATKRPLHDGRIFFERVGPAELVLWRRPAPAWTDVLRGLLEPVPYPAALHLRASSAGGVTTVVASRQTHPATKRAAWFNIVGAVVALAVMATVTEISHLPWVLPVIAVGFFITVSRFLRLRSARRSLLATAYAPLAAHELGVADAEDSAFRARRLPGAGDET